MVRAGVPTTRRVGRATVPGTGADGDSAWTADPGGLRPAREAEGLLVPPTAIVTATTPTPKCPRAAVDSRVFSHNGSELGIRYT
jgi:hypothetical protein